MSLTEPYLTQVLTRIVIGQAQASSLILIQTCDASEQLNYRPFGFQHLINKNISIHRKDKLVNKTIECL